VLAANPETTPLDIETALRAAAGQAYLVSNSTTAGFEIVLGMPAWHAALADAGVTVEQNRAALSTRVLPALYLARISVSFSLLAATMNQKSSLREDLQFVSWVLTGNSC
jgi:hypothetical protein